MRHAASMSLATSAALAVLVAFTVSPASAQTKTWPAGTDCSKLVGNDKTDCANQMKNTNSPDNSNNPDAGSNAGTTAGGSMNTGNTTGTGTTGTGTTGTGTDNQMPTSTTTKNYKGKDCTALVGNEKEECAAQNKQSGAPDNSNNPAQSEPAQSN